jgi:hypothetical protein
MITKAIPKNFLWGTKLTELVVLESASGSTPYNFKRPENRCILHMKEVPDKSGP